MRDQEGAAELERVERHQSQDDQEEGDPEGPILAKKGQTEESGDR